MDDIKTKAQLVDEAIDPRCLLSQAQGKLAGSTGMQENLRLFKRLFSEIDDLAYVCDTSGNILYVNRAFERLTGRTVDDFQGKPFARLFEGEDLKTVMSVYSSTLKGESPACELRFRDTGVVCEYRSMALRDDRGDITGVAWLARDITGRKKAEDALRMEKEMARKYLDLAGVMFVVIDSGGRVAQINKKGREILGCAEKDALGKDWFENFLPERCRDEVRRRFMDMMSGSVAAHEQAQNPVLTCSGRERMILWHNTVLRDDTGRIYAALSSGNDVTEANRAAEELRKFREHLEQQVASRTSELRAANALLEKEVLERERVQSELRKLTKAIEQSVNLVFITDVKGMIEYVNPMFEEVTGWSKEEAVGQNPRILSSGETPKEVYKDLWATVLKGGTWRGEFKNRKKTGEYYWASAVISPILDENGAITHFLAVQEDVTGKKSTDEKIRYLAHYDGTTGLNNRARFIELVNDWIGRNSAKADGALLLLDIDQFKLISDTYGHGLGDEFLRRVGGLLQVTLRYISSRRKQSADTDYFICRLSGDEYAVFLPCLDASDAAEAAEHVRKSLEGFYQSDVHCHMTASIGVAMYPEHGRSTTALLTKADAAMYRAKALGRNRVHVYSPMDHDIEQMHSRLKWKESIMKAVQQGRFEPWFQPIVDLRDNKVKHYEVLARMREEDGRIMPPGPFIDIAERFGLVSSICRAVMEKTFLLQKELHSRGKDVSFCVNISGKELADADFLPFLRGALQKTGASPRHLVFELTETVSLHDMVSAVKFVKSLKSLGCKVSLDEFGVGRTSFLYLKEMQIDFVKIAGPFIKNIEKNVKDRLFVKAITDVAKGMGIETVAEFVETKGAFDHIKEYGVDYAQGFYIGKPSSTTDEVCAPV